MRKRAFTLIELLVVIAIIAILAAILFPVFAQAKEAAKKTANLNNFKQMGLCVNIYITDADDNFPMAFGMRPDGTWGWNVLTPTPENWLVNDATWKLPERINMARTHVNNSVRQYIKNNDIYDNTNFRKTSVSTDDTSRVPGAPQPVSNHVVYNGLLHEYSATGVAQPSRLVMFWSGFGKAAYDGRALSSPALQCIGTAYTDCRFNPAGPPMANMTCPGGFCDGWFWAAGQSVNDPPPTHNNASCYVFTNGWNAVRTDSSAAHYNSGGITGTTIYNTSYNTTPFAQILSDTAPYTMWSCLPPGANSGSNYYNCFFRPDSLFNY
jgi:prepilin-type N-terminal cleavage/methylation domain-containing protein